MISVIFPTRNRAVLLSHALDSLLLQTLPSSTFEVIVVDNGSTDNTAEIAQKYLASLPNLRYFYEPEPGLHVGRHLGMKMAKSEILAYADDDIEAFPTWLEGIAEAFQDPGVALVGGKNLPKFEAEPPDWVLRMWKKDKQGNQILGYLSILDLGNVKKSISPYRVFGCNFSIRKGILLEAGGFHPDSMPKELLRFRGDGETHVSKYVADSGLKCMFHPGASVYHKVTPERMTFAYFRQRGFSQGLSDSYTALRKQTMRNNGRQTNTFYRTARWGWHKLKHFMLWDADLKKALHAFRAGYRHGYAYHQQMYYEDNQVREWVHRKKYYTD